MKSSGSTTSNTIAVILTIAVLVLAWKMVLPGYFSHKTNLTNLESEVNAAKIKLASVEKSKSEMAAIKPITDQLLVSVPKGADEPDLITELEAIAIKNNIVLPSISISTETENGTAGGTNQATPVGSSNSEAASASQTSGTPIVVSFSVAGSFESLNNLISGIETSVRFMNITGLTYGVDSESGGNTLSLQIQAYKR